MIRTILLLLFAVVVLPLVAWYSDTPPSAEILDAIKTLTIAMAFLAGACFLVSEISRNYSQVDKLWSLAPLGYTWYMAYASGWNERLVLMAALVTAWGLRLTYNFSRRGGYSWKFWSGEEDYRWAELRKMPLFARKGAFSLFNLFFISYYQMALILLFTLPTAVAWQGADTPLGWPDYLVAVLLLGFLVMETVADNQHYAFQTEKHRRLKAGEALDGAYADGFCQSGLWARLRHPNYAAEQAIWLCFYLFSVSATGRWINWSLAGAVLLLLLFQGSADFSEGISARKYPKYAEYRKRVGRFLPRLF